jgi:hypothetical protein
MKSVYVIYYINEDKDLVECEVFSKLEYAQKFQEDLEKLYGEAGVGFWRRPIDIIGCSNRLTGTNLITGYKPKFVYGTHILTGEQVDIAWDSGFWE